MNWQEQLNNISCPIRPEESWRRTDPTLFFAASATMLNESGQLINENGGVLLQIVNKPANPNLLTQTLKSLDLGSEWLEILADSEQTNNISVVHLAANQADAYLSNAGAFSISACASNWEPGLPDSPIATAIANRATVVSPEELHIRVKATDTKQTLIVILGNHSNRQSTKRVCIDVDNHCQLALVLIDFCASESTLHRHHIVVGENAQVEELWFVPGRETTKYSQTIVERFESSNADRPSRGLLERQVTLYAKALFRDAQVFVPQDLCRITSLVKNLGSGTHAASGVAAMAGQGTWLDYEPHQLHPAPGGRSQLNCKMIASGDGRGIFQGLVVIPPEGHQTEAFQENKNLLISSSARIDSTPRLQIFPSDVVCKHGSATGELSLRQFYYLMSRGFPREAAKAMLIEAFVADGLTSLDPAGALYRVAEGWLGVALRTRLSAFARNSEG